MTFSSVLRSVSDGYDHKRSAGKARPQKILGGAAFACVAFACAWVLGANLVGGALNQTSTDQAPAPRGARLSVRPPNLVNAYAKLAAAMHGYAELPATDEYAAYFDPHYLLGLAPGDIFNRRGAGSGWQPGGGRRRQFHHPCRAGNFVDAEANRSPRRARRGGGNAAATAGSPRRLDALRQSIPAEKPTIFQRLFGKPATGMTLAYAAPDDGAAWASGQHLRRPLRSLDRGLRHLRAHRLPAGRHDARSAFGTRQPDRRSARREKIRGATPPDVYDLTA